MQERSGRWFWWPISIVVAVMVSWESFRWFAEPLHPRAVPQKGVLCNEEVLNINLFENNKNSVVYIDTAQAVMDMKTRNLYDIPKGAGSGFVWDEKGHIVTNFHVISEANEANIRLNDGRDYPASLVGISPEHDLAVLKINVPLRPPRPIILGTSADLKVGQKVFAIGNPFGLDWTLTTGIVSALDRSLDEDNGKTIRHLIQTDAAINPGNSGGPLLDSAGKLIGVNTAIYSPSGAYAGVGFAIPADTLNLIIPKIIASGNKKR